jgi:hypothetical protein
MSHFELINSTPVILSEAQEQCGPLISSGARSRRTPKVRRLTMLPKGVL